MESTIGAVFVQPDKLYHREQGYPSFRLFNTHIHSTSLNIRHLDRGVFKKIFLCMQIKSILALTLSFPGIEQSYFSLPLLAFTLSAALLGEILWVGICDRENFKNSQL